MASRNLIEFENQSLALIIGKNPRQDYLSVGPVVCRGCRGSAIAQCTGLLNAVLTNVSSKALTIDSNGLFFPNAIDLSDNDEDR